MNAFLPILGALQNGHNAIGVAGSTKEPLGQVIRDQASSTGNTFARAFSQVMGEQEETATLFNQTQAVVFTQPHLEKVLPGLPTQQDSGNPEPLGDPDAPEQTLNESQAYRIQPHPEGPVPATSALETLPYSVSLLSTKSLAASFPGTNEAIPAREQNVVPDPQLSLVNVPTTHSILLEGFHPTARVVFQGREFLSPGENSPLGYVREAFTSELNVLGNAQAPLPKVLEAGVGPQQVPTTKVPELGIVPPPVPLQKGLEAGVGTQQAPITKVAELGIVSQQIPQEQAGKQTSVVLNGEGELSPHTVVTPGKDVLRRSDQGGRSVHQDGTQPIPQLQRPSLNPNPSAPLQFVLSNRAPFVAAVQAEGPAGFPEQASISQSSVKPTPGLSSVFNDVTGSVSEHRHRGAVDLLAEPGLFGKGERSQTMVETTVKSMGLDSSGGQGLGAGMNHFAQSQSGFQQSSSFPGQGMGLRALEERGAELPTPALQRLQMDVQLSENTRVQIDVGVQNRQVYAGLVMDHAVLRNLAAQFVPQLENQLAQVNLELEEFSAEVREERQQNEDVPFNNPRSQDPQGGGFGSTHEVGPIQNMLNRSEGRGLHLVA